jgi:nuclear pore complex protein Nup107
VSLHGQTGVIYKAILITYSNRLHRADPSFEPSDSERQVLDNPYITPEDLTQAMVDEDSELSLWAVSLSSSCIWQSHS